MKKKILIMLLLGLVCVQPANANALDKIKDRSVSTCRFVKKVALFVPRLIYMQISDLPETSMYAWYWDELGGY